MRYVRTDATDENDVKAAMAEAEAAGPLRISVDAHGGPASGGRLVGKDGEPLDLAGFRKTIDFYLTAVFNVMRLAAAAIAHQEAVDGDRGIIVNTASIAAYEGQIGQIPYAAAKGGVVGMTLVAARDLSPLGIRVVTIAPGTFLTPPTARRATNWRPTGGPRSRTPSVWAAPPSTRRSWSTSARTTISTARSSASTAPSASRRSERPSERPSEHERRAEGEGGVRRRGEPGHRPQHRAGARTGRGHGRGRRALRGGGPDTRHDPRRRRADHSRAATSPTSPSTTRRSSCATSTRS